MTAARNVLPPDGAHSRVATSLGITAHAQPPLRAAFVLRGFQPGQWRSQAEGRWLIVSAEGNQAVQQGSVILITEGARDVAVFVVEQMSLVGRP